MPNQLHMGPASLAGGRWGYNEVVSLCHACEFAKSEFHPFQLPPRMASGSWRKQWPFFAAFLSSWSSKSAVVFV